MSALRPLPPRPSLEYEHKQAKALLRRLRAGEPESLARASAQHPKINLPLAGVRLADAQLVIAREYGFASWPRLVHWFADVERQQHALMQLHFDRDVYEGKARGLLAEHHERKDWARRAVAAYVPRFYGLSLDEVSAGALSEDDAQLAVARMTGAPSWEVLVERLEAATVARSHDSEDDPMRHARVAMVAADLAALQRVVEARPELMHPSCDDAAAGHTLMGLALWQERIRGADAMRPIMEWLTTQGLDRQRELNNRLCGHMSMKPEGVRSLLDQGADPNWIAPNGLSVLEHALIRYWNGDAVDVLAARTTPRSALWIAAGLGDVDGVRGFLDRRHKPTLAAHRMRPDFVAAGMQGAMPPMPYADDEEVLLEVLLIVVLNGRTKVLDYLAAHGAPLNSLLYGTPLTHIAVGNAMTDVAECLVRCGADLDLSGPDSRTSAREIAREMFELFPDDVARRRIVELCGMHPDAILAERDARPVPTPVISSTLAKALQLARRDAAYLGQADVRPENLLVGLLRGKGPPLYFLKDIGRMQVGRFRADEGERFPVLDDAGAAEDEHGLPMHDDADAALSIAVSLASERRLETVEGLHLLLALTSSDRGPVAELLMRYGASASTIKAELERSL